MRLTWLFAVAGEIDEPLGDLTVAEAGGDQCQHLALALGQLLELGGRVALVVGLGDELGDQLTGSSSSARS